MTVGVTLGPASESETDDKYKRTIYKVQRFQITSQEDSHRNSSPDQCVSYKMIAFRSLY